MTIAEWLTHATETLASTSTTARLDASVLLAHATGRTKAYLRAHDDEPLRASTLKSLDAQLQRRCSDEPIAYITGRAEFAGHEFTVNKHVLVPRPESEAFLELLATLRTTERVHTLVDIGTGSGCLAIAIKLAHPDLYVTATDISKAALRVAARNALALGAAVTLKEQSLLTGNKEGYDVVVANLPYVPKSMQHPSIAHEPSLALYSGEDGLDHYRALFAQLARKHIRFVMIESLPQQHKDVTQLAVNANYQHTKTIGLVQLFTNNRDILSLL